MGDVGLAVLVRNYHNLLEAASERASTDPSGLGRVAFRGTKRWKAPAELLAAADGPVPIYFRTGESYGESVTHEAQLERVLIDEDFAEQGRAVAEELAIESTANEKWDRLKTVYVIRRCRRLEPVPVSTLKKQNGEPAAGGQAVYSIVMATDLKPLGSWFPEEADVALAGVEGAAQRVLVNRYERSPVARRLCIEAHGTRCIVCDLSFEERYGERGKDYIHVHHRTPLATLENPKAFDPTKDLVPVCPNCHAMLHRGSHMLSVDELKAMLK